MPRIHPFVWSLTAGFWLAYSGQALADTPPAKKAGAVKYAPSKFIRVTRDDRKQPTALETAVVRYVPASGENGLVVDLVGVVHVGDRAYYEKLDKALGEYDVVLYELVAPKGTRVPRGGARNSGNPLALLQGMMKTVLQLESQTERIDYTRKNFVHADLSPDEMWEAMQKRGETGLTLVLGVVTDVLRQANLQEQKGGAPAGLDEEFDPLAMLFDPQAAVKLKRVMATQLETMDTDAGLGQTLNHILITDRNKAAMTVFQKELVKGTKKIAIFYGAAHMPDFERRLLADFGMRRQGQQWHRAWDLSGRGGRPAVMDLLKLLE
jgi:hypothetical protein